MTEEQKILNRFEIYLNLKSIKTKDYYLKSAVDFFSYLKEEHKSFNRVKKTIGEEYRNYLLSREDKELSRSTINNKLNHLRIFYRFLLKKGTVPFNPFYGVENLKTAYTIPKDILSTADIKILLSNFSQLTDNDVMAKSMIELLYGSGLRISEVCSIKLCDINFINNYVTITDFKSGGKLRKVPATEVSLSEVKRYIDTSMKKLVPETSDYLYPQKCKTSIRCMLNRKLKNECQRSGLKVITTHSFRHCAGTHLLRSGAGIREVQAFLGHESIKSTQVYTRVVKDDLKELINKYHPRETEL